MRAQYDTLGNLRNSWDGRNNLTQTAYSSTYDYAYPTSVTTPVPDSSGVQGSNVAFTSSTVYDFNTGLPTSTTEVNDQTTTFEYNDALLRPTKVTAPNGHQTITEYGAGTSAPTRWVKVKSQIEASSWSEAISNYDGLGRTYLTEKTDSSGYVFTETEYDTMGRVKRSTNPYKTGETKLWTTPEYDDLSRVKKITSPDTDDIQTAYGLSTSGTVGITKTVTDQAGKKRKGITNALGQMIRVIEDPDSSALVTDYVFDLLGNLRKTTQGEQSRYFMYDSLGRLLYAKQPEQDTNSSLTATDSVTNNTAWSVKYVYDANSNITTTTDARNQTIFATYDKRNRISLRDYSDIAMPDVSFYYDGTGLDSVPNYSKGKTTKVISSVSETRNTGFDQMGRLLTSEQRTDGVTYPFEYTYNLSGGLIEEKYPSGRVVKNTLNADGELAQVQSRKNSNYGFFTYASSFAYDASGAVTKMQLGNGRWETAAYNERLQVTQIGLGATDATQNLLKLEFKYNTTGQTDNNGSMREQKITVPTVGSNPGFTATQTYVYDNLNRIQSATENISTQTWKQTFNYDRYGNRRFDAANTTTLGSCSTAVCNPTISTANNRFSTGQGYSYDATGSVTQDAAGQRFGYDAESHQKEFFAAGNSGGTPDATYHYDGDGKRVKKIVGTEVTIFVYNASGQLAAEYSSQIETVSPKVSYLTTDHLGSPRIITDANGAVTSRKDFAAFGDETLTPHRISGLGYVAPNVRYDYTGYEKDAESGLEYAQARYFNPTHGRFTSVDPLTASATTRNPQTFNRYSYVLNSPYKFTDPLGLIPFGLTPGSARNCCNERGRPGGGVYFTNSPFLDWAVGSAATGNDDPIDYSLPYCSQGHMCFGTQAEMSRLMDTGMSKSEIWLSRAFLGPGTYFSNPNDGDPVDQTTGVARNRASATRDPHNHGYPSMTDPDARGSFYVPDGGEITFIEPLNSDGSGEKMNVVYIYFKQLGELQNITIAAYHLVNINRKMPRDSTGRRKLGDIDLGAAGSWSYKRRLPDGSFVKDSSNASMWLRGVHVHVEVYRGYHSSRPDPKPHTNFNNVVR